MSKLYVGDTVSCKINDAVIVSPYRSYNEIKSFVIVAVDEYGYYLFIPHYIFLKDTFLLDNYRCSKLGIHDKFIGENIIYIQDNLVNSVESYWDGMTCKVCLEFHAYAEFNQLDNSFICFSCRSNPYR